MFYLKMSVIALYTAISIALGLFELVLAPIAAYVAVSIVMEKESQVRQKIEHSITRLANLILCPFEMGFIWVMDRIP